MSNFQLVVLEGPDRGRKLDLKLGSGHILGRQQDSVYKLTDPRTSRRHCEVRYEEDQIKLVDQGSAAGTFVNGQKITEKILKPGDVVQVGDTRMRLQVGDAEQSTTVIGGKPAADYDIKATEQLSDLCGRELAHFNVGEVLGKGVSSMVFRAVNKNDNKQVALKVMQPSFSQNDEEMQRFVRAMKTMLPLRHQNLVALLGAGKSGPYCWIAMELIEGESLTKVIQRIGVAGMLDWKHAYRVGVHVARALEYAHGQKIIHRNIMPANILIQAADKQAKLGDLMLAKALEGTFAMGVTRPGEILGEVNYMAPERTHPQSSSMVDGRSDLFSLGGTVYAMLTGKPPFAGTNMIDTITKIRSAEVVKPSKFQMAIPGLFEGVILKLLAKAPDERYQTATELLQELERIGKFTGASA
jgi:serine/threonine protein kinase